MTRWNPDQGERVAASIDALSVEEMRLFVGVLCRLDPWAAIRALERTEDIVRAVDAIILRSAGGAGS